MTSPAGLTRRLGLGDAVFIGLGSMLGAGVFAAFSPAAPAAWPRPVAVAAGILLVAVLGSLGSAGVGASPAALSAVVRASGWGWPALRPRHSARCSDSSLGSGAPCSQWPGKGTS